MCDSSSADCLQDARAAAAGFKPERPPRRGDERSETTEMCDSNSADCLQDARAVAHAVMSASSAKRWLHCPPSALINAGAQKDTVYTREGTLAHSFAELKARKYFTTDIGPRKYISELKKLQADPLYQKEMDAHTDAYLDALKGFAGEYAELPHVALEVRVDFSAWVPEGFGTADCVMLGGTMLHVVDFKYGKGVPVSAEENPQMMLYALGAMTEYGALYDIETVKMSIVQPRLSAAPETVEMSAEALLTWAENIVAPAARLAAKGEGEKQEGDWCRWCEAAGRCRRQAETFTALDSLNQALPPLLSDDEVGRALTVGQRLQAWLEKLNEYALATCLSGGRIPGYKAVEGRATRAWTDQEAAFSAARKLGGVPDEMLFERKAVTLAGLEKLMGKDSFGRLLGPYVSTPPGKPTLAPESDRRPAILARIDAAAEFGAEENPDDV